MTRTFSKIYGLGGLRVGWGYAQQEVIDVLNRIRGPFNMSTMALAGAEAAVRDFMLSLKGFDAATAFLERHSRLLRGHPGGLEG